MTPSPEKLGVIAGSVDSIKNFPQDWAHGWSQDFSQFTDRFKKGVINGSEAYFLGFAFDRVLS